MHTAVLPSGSVLGSYRHGNGSGALLSPAASTATMTTRKRKRAMVPISYSEIKETDAAGRTRDVIVIEDTPPPSTLSPSVSIRNGLPYGSFSASYQPPVFSAPVRTRARAAREAEQQASDSSATGTGTGSAVAMAPPQKKRKRNDVTADVRLPPAKKLAQDTVKSWDSGTAQSKTGTDDTSKGVPSCDDKEGHYIIIPDDIIYNRYKTIRLLGQGTFGKVVEALDTKSNTKVALKIIRAIPKYRDASKIEVRVLQKLRERDPLNRHKCIHLLHWFDHRNHICLVTELLGMCVYDFLKDNQFEPFPRRHIQDFAKQLLGSVAFLHDLHLIHTDLKPENILLVHNDYRTTQVHVSGRRVQTRAKRILSSTDIRLIDFGSATFESEYHSTVVSTRHYRAPEIILGLGWSYPCDVYSLGCILVEFFTGNALFQTHDNLEHLAMMEKVMGRMPDRFARAGARSKPEFFKDSTGNTSKLDWPKPKASTQSKKEVRATKALHDIIQPSDNVNRQFIDLVRRLLAFDPSQRITVREALNHPYFNIIIPDES